MRLFSLKILFSAACLYTVCGSYQLAITAGACNAGPAWLALMLVLLIAGIPALIALFIMESSAKAAKVLIAVSIILWSLITVGVMTDQLLPGLLALGPFLVVLVMIGRNITGRKQ